MRGLRQWCRGALTAHLAGVGGWVGGLWVQACLELLRKLRERAPADEVHAHHAALNEAADAAGDELCGRVGTNGRRRATNGGLFCVEDAREAGANVFAGVLGNRAVRARARVAEWVLEWVCPGAPSAVRQAEC